MKTKKLLSLLLALMMMLSVVPMYASAAEPIALTEANITIRPSIEGEIYYGQAIGNNFTVNGGEVQYNGEIILGTFQLTDAAEYIPTKNTNTGTYDATIQFIPADESSYAGFSTKGYYNILNTTPIVVTAPFVEGTVDSGTRLTRVSISQGKIKNPYNYEEIDASWAWVDRRASITSSGWHEVALTNTGYEKITMKIYIRLTGDDSEMKIGTVIEELPTVVNNLSYGDDWSTVELSGGKVVDDVNGLEVPGKFTINRIGTITSAGDIKTEVLFSPDDETYATSTSTIDVTVNKGQMKFVDENGNEIVPEITVPYGTTFGDIHYYLESYVAGDDAVSIGMVGIENANKTLCETGTYTASLINRTDSNYERTEKEFKIIVEAKKLEPTVKSNTGYYVVDDSGTYNVEGTFDVYIDGELYKTGVKYLEKVAYTPEKSGTHEIKFVYKPVENDNFAIDNEIKDTFSINLVHKLTLGDNVLGKPGDYRYSTEIELSANSTAENFEGWVITDAAGNTVDLGVDLTATKITITMPDFDIHVEALEKNASSGGSGGLGDIDFGDLSEGDSEWAIINIIRNLIAMFKSFLQQLIETFQSIGG